MVYLSIGLCGLCAVMLIILISFIAYPFSTLATKNYTSDSTAFSMNDSIRNLTNPILKIEPNPLANLSNPLANPLMNIIE
jgi:hypothetical protein